MNTEKIKLKKNSWTAREKQQLKRILKNKIFLRLIMFLILNILILKIRNPMQKTI